MVKKSCAEILGGARVVRADVVEKYF